MSRELVCVQMHVVAYNTDLYDDFASAVKGVKGIAVIAVFMQVGKEANKPFQEISKEMKRLLKKDDKVMVYHLDLNQLLPSTEHYITYDGSLTYPGCYETVTWIILNKPAIISTDQCGPRGVTLAHRQVDITALGAAQELSDIARDGWGGGLGRGTAARSYRHGCREGRRVVGAVVAARAVQRTREPGRAAGGCERQTDHAPEPSGGEDQHQHEETGTCWLIASVYLNTTGMGVSTKEESQRGVPEIMTMHCTLGLLTNQNRGRLPLSSQTGGQTPVLSYSSANTIFVVICFELEEFAGTTLK
ncbi:hypothetical protein C0Q70_05987 [Pomacea canaliculata]|uniref:Alpha-carbonic anhydrase domain-containing protein n=1 Tax=Pomacea canaliculata TaxID=400727 RepID=A0A2T7PMR1_POMCA|nr:hypothetical protein C0Q70_05987 [Pomacea canaliculata]